MKKVSGVLVLGSLVGCSPLLAQSPSSLSLLIAARPPVAPWTAMAPGDVVSGYMLGSPLGYTFVGATKISLHWPGFSSGGSPPAGIAQPEFDKFFVQVFGTMGERSPVAAMSMGMEVITIHDKYVFTADDTLDDAAPPANGSCAVLQPGTHGWVALEFAVNKAELEQGDDLAPDIAALNGGAVGASVFSFVVPESSTELLPNELTSVCSIACDHLGLRATDQLAAIDLHAALFYTDLGLYDAIFSNRAPDQDACIYFTLRPDFLATSAGALQTLWGMSVAPDAATIYMSKWMGSEWSRPPQVYRTAADLRIPMQEGSQPPKDLKDKLIAIDGLAIDAKTPGTLGDDDILFSLAKENDPNPSFQIRYTKAQDPSPSPPRRVIAPRRGNGYGSLGRMMRAGAAHGDFCQLDPLLDHRDWKGFESMMRSAVVLDDFAIARRLRPDGAYVAARGEHVVNGSSPANSPIPAIVGGEPGQTPRLALPVASYRWTREAVAESEAGSRRPIMRTCMSWPRFVPVVDTGAGGGLKQGQAWVRYGDIDNLAKYVVDPSSVVIAWHVTDPKVFTGAPLVHDLDLPTNGLLPRPPADPKKPGNALRAYAAQWFVEYDGRFYTSPLSVLRY